MKLHIHLDATYRYDEEVSFSPHIFRLFPRLDGRLRLLESAFQTNDGAVVQFRHDLFDNEIARIFYPNPGSELKAVLTLKLAVQERNPFDFLLDERALNFPIEYTDIERRMLAPYLTAEQPCTLPFWEPPQPGTPTISLLTSLNEALHTHIAYERRETGDPHPAEETLRQRSGSCRDFMVLHAGVLRTLGIPTRLVSGYVCEMETAEKRAEGALHAWTEAYLPGAGWVGLDPTNGVFCNHNHIATAVGLSPADIAPVSGNYFSNHVVASMLDARLQLDHEP